MRNAVRAFTLIELLVVLTIIGIITSIVFIYYPSAREEARNTARISDIKELQAALEMYRLNEGHYPETLTPGTALIGSTSSTTYMKVIPGNPQSPATAVCGVSTAGYTYNTENDGHQYSLNFCLSKATNGLSAGKKCATNEGIADGACFVCGDQITITTLAGYACSTGAPNYDTCAYDTVQIGTQCWMKQNMNVGQYVTGATTQTNDSNLQKYCYGDNTGNCSTEGGLYQWDEAMQYSTTELAQGICPEGWHIPTDTEQNTLDQYLTDSPNTCDANRSGTWNCANAGTKLQAGGTSGFEGLLAGDPNTLGSFVFQGMGVFFWSSSINGSNAWVRDLYTGYAGVSRDPLNRAYGFSVRCLQD